MRILFVVPRFHTNQFQMVKTLQEKGHEVIFHVASYGLTEDYSLLKPVVFAQSKISLLVERFFGKGGTNRPNYFPNPVLYLKAYREVNPDVVIIRDPYKIFSLLVAFYSLFKGTKIIFYTQEELFRQRSYKTRIKQQITIWIFKAAWITPIIGGENGKNRKLKHMYYVPLPIPINNEVNTKEVSDWEVPKLLMVGKYHQSRKRHYLFLQALSILSRKYHFKATIVGECKRESQIQNFQILNNQIDELGLREIVDLKTNVLYQHMNSIYKSHHVFVLPAISEPHGASVVEALGNGLPAICTDSCGARFNISNGEDGFVIKSDSLDELIGALEKFLSNKCLISKMSEYSLKYVSDSLSGEAFYRSFEKVLTARFHAKVKGSVYTSSN